jgi:hypothetical protein
MIVAVRVGARDARDMELLSLSHSMLGPRGASLRLARELHAVGGGFDGNFTDDPTNLLYPALGVRIVSEGALAALAELMATGNMGWVCFPPPKFRF